MKHMDCILKTIFYDVHILKKYTIVGRIVISISLVLVAIMAYFSRNDLHLFNALIWFLLPLLIIGGLTFTSNLENPILRVIRKTVLVLWWIAMIVGIVYTIIHFSNPWMAKAFGGFIFLIVSGAITLIAKN